MSILDTKAIDKPMNFQPALTLNDPHKITALPLFVLLERFMRWRASGMSGIPGVTTRIQILNITLPRALPTGHCSAQRAVSPTR
jgi:hypothetical protein